MSTSCDGGSELPFNRNDDSVHEDLIAAPLSGGVDDSGVRSGSDLVGSAVEADRVSVAEADRSVEARGSDGANLSVDVKLENEEPRLGDGSEGEGGAPDKQPSSSPPSDSGEKKTDMRVVETEHKKVKLVTEDYDSILSEFDQFASKGAGEAVGYGYEIGDMVWGKVKSHPWWPGYIYNEAFASPSVSKTKRNGHVLVAFFGDSSYGWFELAELIPFAENFSEKSRQTNSRGFMKAVEEAMGEFSRRRSLALACRCRNKFNFWPSQVEGYFVVDVGDFEPGVYSLNQIHKVRENFQPKEMLSFVEQLALWPRTNQYGTIEFIKNKATALACRRVMFEEFDETYAQAFGSTPVHPPRPNMPVAVDPAKAPLSGPLVFAEALGKGEVSAKPTKIKESIEDKYIFKRRDEAIPMNLKKANAGQASSPAHPFLLDGSSLIGARMESSPKGHIDQIPVSGINDSQLQPISHQGSLSSDVKPLEGSRKIIGGIKKVKVKKQRAGEPSTENPALVEKKRKRKKDASTEPPAGEFTPASVNLVEKKKKRKKEMKNETGANLAQLPLATSNSGLAAEKASGMLVDVPLIVNNQLDTQKDVVAMISSSTIEKQQAVERKKLKFSMLLKDLRALALNPCHGADRGCPATARQVFLKFRALVYQKSLVLLSSENEKSEATSTALPGSMALRGSTEKLKDKLKKLIRPAGRLDDPTKGGKKRGPSDSPEVVKKKKRPSDDSLDIEKKKRVDSEGIKKKTVSDMKSIPMEKKVSQRPSETQRENVKSIASKNIPSVSTKVVKLESSKRMEVPQAKASNKPAMLVMKFPTDASLPSGVELRAKFTRFGPMDHSATRVFWKSYTCRLVFRRRADADAALKYALSTNNLFGNTNVRSYVRDVEVDAPEHELVRVQRDESSCREGRAAARPLPAVQASPPRPQQHVAPIKSCLKKPAGEEGNNGRGTSRVKFVLGGEASSGSSKSEQVPSSSTAATAYAQVHSMDVSSSKNLAKLIPESSGGQLQRNLPINMLPPSSSAEPSSSVVASSSSTGSNRQMGSRRALPPPPPPPPPPNNDIAQQFLNLLTRCSEVVNSLSVALGYVPYHSL